VQLINECTSIKIPIQEGEKEVNMSNGLEVYANHKAEKAAAKAAIQASIEAWQEDYISREEIISRLERKYQLDAETAAEYYEKYSVQSATV
jgi:hypothetical protein